VDLNGGLSTGVGRVGKLSAGKNYLSSPARPGVGFNSPAAGMLMTIYHPPPTPAAISTPNTVVVNQSQYALHCHTTEKLLLTVEGKWMALGI